MSAIETTAAALANAEENEREVRSFLATSEAELAEVFRAYDPRDTKPSALKGVEAAKTRVEANRKALEKAESDTASASWAHHRARLADFHARASKVGHNGWLEANAERISRIRQLQSEIERELSAIGGDVANFNADLERLRAEARGLGVERPKRASVAHAADEIRGVEVFIAGTAGKLRQRARDLLFAELTELALGGYTTEARAEIESIDGTQRRWEILNNRFAEQAPWAAERRMNMPAVFTDVEYGELAEEIKKRKAAEEQAAREALREHRHSWGENGVPRGRVISV